MPSREALKREPVALVSDAALQRRAEVDAHMGSVPLLRASAVTRLGLVAVAISILWLAVYWALR